VALGLGGPGKRRLPARSRIGFFRHPIGRFGASGTGLAGLPISKISTSNRRVVDRASFRIGKICRAAKTAFPAESVRSNEGLIEQP
jgi:hypothetical protein